MQQCPKCASSVPDGRTACQICGAEMDPETTKVTGPTGLQNPVNGPRPLTGDEQLGPMPGIPGIDRPAGEDDVLAKQIGGGQQMAQSSMELRRTLSGDVVEVPVAGPVRPGGPMLGAGGASGPVGPPPRPIPTAGPAGRSGTTLPPLRAGGGPTRSMGSETSSGGKSSAAIVLVVLLILILAGAAAGYWYWQQTRPAAAVTMLMENLNARKWDAVYDQIELPEQAKSMVTKDTFVKIMGMVGAQRKIESYEIKSSKIDGDTATVTVAATVSVGDAKKSDTGDIPLRKVNGVWKVDVTQGARGMPGMPSPQLPGMR